MAAGGVNEAKAEVVDPVSALQASISDRDTGTPATKPTGRSAGKSTTKSTRETKSGTNGKAGGKATGKQAARRSKGA